MKLNVKFQNECLLPIKFNTVNTYTDASDYSVLINKPSINGIELIGDKTSEELHIAASFPEEGLVGDILMKTGATNNDVSWVTPASDTEQDNTRPITSAAVYTEIGNINALLATI